MNSPIPPDDYLVSLVRRGDTEAFGLLLNRHSKKTHQLAVRMVGNKSIAEELVQEAFLQAYLALEHLQDNTRFGGWLYAIVINACRNYLRRPSLQLLSLDNIQEGLIFQEPLTNARTLNPQELQEQRELHQLILSAIQTLSPHNRSATLLFYYEELSLVEIANLLQISVSAVKGRLHKARKQLYLQLTELLSQSGYYSSQKSQNEGEKMVKVKVAGVKPSLMCEQHRIVVLAEEDGERVLPLFMGNYEADQIAIALRNIAVARPLIYDFMLKVLEGSDTSLKEVVIQKVQDNTYYAVAWFFNEDKLYSVDARPSDAVALALRTNSPIYAMEDLLITPAPQNQPTP